MHVSSIDGKIFMFKRRCVQIKANNEQIMSRAKKMSSTVNMDTACASNFGVDGLDYKMS